MPHHVTTTALNRHANDVLQVRGLQAELAKRSKPVTAKRQVPATEMGAGGGGGGAAAAAVAGTQAVDTAAAARATNATAAPTKRRRTVPSAPAGAGGGGAAVRRPLSVWDELE